MRKLEKFNDISKDSSWNITYSYKYDLASFCNLFTKSEQLIELHEEGYDDFKEVIEAKPEFIELAQNMQKGGFDPRIVLVSAFDQIDHDGADIEKLCSVLEEPGKKEKLRDYYVHKKELVTEETWNNNLAPLLPTLAQMARYIHENGFQEYWEKKYSPLLERRVKEIESNVLEYNIIDEINKLLGQKHKLQFDQISLQLSCFSAPFGTKLKNQSFLTDTRWELKDIILIALHEMIHPPFSRDKIEEIAEFVWDDDLIQEAYEKQPSSSSYNTPVRFLEEHLTEAAHIYLGEKLGMVESPLIYFAEHDNGSHVVSVVVYDFLKKNWGEESESLEAIIDKMVEEKILYPNKIRDEYLRIYKEANIKPPFN